MRLTGFICISFGNHKDATQNLLSCYNYFRCLCRFPIESEKVWKKVWSFSSLEKSAHNFFGLLVWKKKMIDFLTCIMIIVH